MEELAAGIRDLHSKVQHLDEMLREDQAVRDMHERLGAAVAASAEEATRIAAAAHGVVKRIFLAITVAMAVWTPFVAYGAVWAHELVRNTCYNGVTLVEPNHNHWYCNIFPGTNQHAGD